jgi:hypothetical protein
MNHPENHAIHLAGPCGYYCGGCRHYLARAKGLLKEKNLKHGCRDCRVQDKMRLAQARSRVIEEEPGEVLLRMPGIPVCEPPEARPAPFAGRSGQPGG